MAWLGLLLLFLLAGCGGPTPQPPDRIYQDARLLLRQGKLDKVLAEVDRNLKRPGTGSGSPWRDRFVLLKAEALVALDRPDDVIATLDGGPAVTDPADAKALWRLLRARALTMQRKHKEAAVLLEEALGPASETALPALRAEAALAKAFLHIRTQNWIPAEAAARQALDEASRSGDTYLQAAALRLLGSRWFFNSRYDQAIPWYEQSIAVSEERGYRHVGALARHNLGICYFRLGDYDRALQLYSYVQRDYAACGDLVGQEKCLGVIGNVHLLRGDYVAAMASYRKALELARQIKETDDVARWQSNLAQAALDANDLETAEASISEAVALREKVPDELGGVWVQFNLARIAAGRGRIQEAHDLYSRTIESATNNGMTAAILQARAKLGSLYLQQGNARDAEAQFQAIAAEGESNRSRLGRDEWKLTFQSSVIPFYRDYIEFLIENGRAAEALEVAESCRARLLAEKLGLERKAIRRIRAADLVAKARASNTVFLSFWLAPKRSLLWAVTPRALHWFPLPADKEISRLVESHNDLIAKHLDAPEIAGATGARLYDFVIGPARNLIPPGADVVVVPDGSLHELNLETLLASAAPPRYWIEDVTVTIAPSLALLQAEGRSPARHGRLLLLGSPVQPAPEFPPLPAAEQEVAGIGNLFEGDEKTIITGVNAHPSAYKEASPGRFGLIHFSAHAVANRESPLDSSVILSRKSETYKLYARDVAALPLLANVVTISACKSAGARTYSGEGLVGFAWAFLQAGARNIIAGLWDVSDRSTAELMIRLYEELTKGARPADALRAAKLAMLRSSGPYSRPYYWAPFQLYTRATPIARPRRDRM